MKRILVFLLSLALTGCALRGTEVAGVRTADALSESYPADAERFAVQAALELSRRYPAGQTGLSLVTVPGMFGSALETSLRGYGFAILPAESASGVKVGYVLDEIAGELMPTGYLQIATSDGVSFSMIRKILGGLPSASTAPAAPAPVSAPEEVAPGTPVLQPETRTPATPAVAQTALHEPAAPAPQKTAAPTPLSSPSVHSGDGKTMPIITAVRTVIPVNWQYRIEGTELRQTRVPYPRNIGWRIALTDIATATDSQVVIDGKAKRVSFTPKGMQPAPMAAQVPVPAPVAAPVQPESPAVASALNDAAAQAGPAVTASETTNGAPKIEATPVPATSPAITIVAEPMLPEWQLTPGSLHVQLEEWGKRGGYQLVWNADTDLDMQSRASFRGNFIGAVTQLFEGLHAAGFPLRATLYPANNVLEVGDK